MIIGGCCPDIWDGREQCLPGGDISLIRDQDEIVGAGCLVRWLCENIANRGGLLIDVGSYELPGGDHILSIHRKDHT